MSSGPHRMPQTFSCLYSLCTAGKVLSVENVYVQGVVNEAQLF